MFPRRSTLAASLLLLLFFAMVAPETRGQYASAVTFTGFGISGSQDATVGYVFTLYTDVLVLGLSYYDLNGDGLVASHPVVLFDSDRNLLTATTVASGTADPLLDGFRVAPIVPIQLLGGHTYVIAGYNTDGADPYVGLASGFSTNLAVIYEYGVSQSGFTYPNVPDTGHAPSNFGGSFVLAVPEPSVLALCMIIFLGAGVCIRRRTKLY